MSKKIQNIAVLIEFLAGSGLAIFFHWVLHYEEAAYTIFGIGILLTLVTYLLREDLEQTRESLLEKYHQAHEVTFAIAQITDPDCHLKAHELMASSMRTISLLQQGYIPMDETEFYLEGARQMDQAAHQAKTVDPLTTGWDSRGVLLNFYQANLRALDRGIKINRIFVVNREDLLTVEAQKILVSHFDDDIEVRIAFRDELPSASDISNRDTNSSFDFAIFDDRIVTDVFSQPGKYFGKKTSQPAEVTKYLHLYDLIEHSSHPVAVEGDRILLAGDAIPLSAGVSSRMNRQPMQEAVQQSPDAPSREPQTSGKPISDTVGASTKMPPMTMSSMSAVVVQPPEVRPMKSRKGRGMKKGRGTSPCQFDS